MFPILNLPPTSLPVTSLWVIPVHQPQASCIMHRNWICFIYDTIHFSMLFSQIIPLSPSPTESKRLFYTSVSLLLSHRVIITVFLNSIYMHSVQLSSVQSLKYTVLVFYFLAYFTLCNRLQFHPPH